MYAKSVFFAGILVAIFSISNTAALAEPFNWTGCYVGVNGGYGWNNGRTTYQDPNTTPDPINGIQFPGGVPLALSIPVPSPSQKGWLGGGVVGCNWQPTRQWVLGVVADINGGNIDGSQTNVGPQTTGDAAVDVYSLGPAGPVTANPAFVANAYESVSMRWLSTLRGRVGVPVNERILLFATGGLAIGGVKTEGNVNIIIPGVPGSQSLWAGSSSKTMVGYAIGGGAEWAFHDHWTFNANYLWYDLGTVSHPLNCVTDTFGCGGGGAYLTLGNARTSISGSILRIGINYKFN